MAKEGPLTLIVEMKNSCSYISAHKKTFEVYILTFKWYISIPFIYKSLSRIFCLIFFSNFFFFVIKNYSVQKIFVVHSLYLTRKFFFKSFWTCFHASYRYLSHLHTLFHRENDIATLVQTVSSPSFEHPAIDINSCEVPTYTLFQPRG